MSLRKSLAAKNFMSRLAILLCLVAVFSAHQIVMAQSPGAVAIATAHPYATDAGEEILRAGGNAFDAAVAITAVLAVVEPYGSGLGGGGFWLLYRAADHRRIMVDGREVSPLSASKDMYLDEQGNVIEGLSINGAKAAAIPGVPAALQHIANNYGRLPLKKVLQPAIRYAEQGFPVTERYRKLAGFRLLVMQSFPETARVFLRDNQIPSVGYHIVQTDLAQMLKHIAEHGAAYFYRGDLAEKMVQHIRSEGGLWRMKDLSDYRIIERQPVSFRYKHVRIISASLPSSGGIVLAQSLGILEQFDLHHMVDGQRKHMIIEAMRRAYRDRAFYLGDTDFVDVPQAKLLSQDYIKGLAAGIDSNRATLSSDLEYSSVSQQTGTQTTHFSVIDKAGNRVAATLSINLPFGSAFMVPGTGILLNNEMDDFSAKVKTPNSYGLVSEHANAIAPGKRPLSSMSPTFIEAADRVGILGTPGGSRIISMVLLGILDFIDGKLPQSWVSIPRYHHQYLPDEVQFEQGALNPDQRVELEKRGHVLREKSRRYGNMQAVLWDKKNNQLFAASDPRGEGKAVVITD